MRTVQMTLEPELIQAVDRAARRLKTTRSGFTRRALAAALKNLRDRERERRHREGYLRQPISHDEQTDWEDEQVGPQW